MDIIPAKRRWSQSHKRSYRVARRVWSAWGFHALAAAAVIAYGLSTFIVVRPQGGHNWFWDVWVLGAACMLPAAALLNRARKGPLGAAWLALGVGIVLNTAGRLTSSYHNQVQHLAPGQDIGDVLTLLSYVLFILGVAILTQSSFGRVHPSVRLDGAISGLAIAAVSGSVWLGPILAVRGQPVQVALALAYPLCDIVLIVLLVAGLAPHHYRPNAPTTLLMAGIAWFVVGDVVSLDQTATGTYRSGTPMTATWLLGLFFMGLAAALEDRRRSGAPRASVTTPLGINLIPVGFGVVSLGVLASSLVHQVVTPVLSLAIAALGMVILRMAMTLREVQSSAANYQAARTDPLTGLPNRRAFMEKVENALESQDLASGHDGALHARAKTHSGMLLIDLDGFKEVNDSLGHAAGDELLCAVAKRFANCVGHRGVLARLGGDEYAYACAVQGKEALVKTANAMVHALVDPVVIDGVSVHVGASIGVAVAPHSEATSGELLRCADVAMYEAKRSQTGVAVYNQSTDPNSRERLALLDSLREAIEDRKFELYYQPTRDLHTGEVHGVEALVRWPHRELGLLLPEKFIPLAEQNGLMPKLTRAVLDQALAKAADLHRSGHALQLSVNISRYDLVDLSLAGYISERLEHYNVDPAKVTLEVTETAIGGDTARTRRCVHELRARGVRISIDDFGVGYSSMSQLLDLAVDELKIDRSFVLQLGTDPRSCAIVRSTVELARALELSTVAEGVGTIELLDKVVEMGVDVGQGFAISEPLDDDQLDRYLSKPAHLGRELAQRLLSRQLIVAPTTALR